MNLIRDTNNINLERHALIHTTIRQYKNITTWYVVLTNRIFTFPYAYFGVEGGTGDRGFCRYCNGETPSHRHYHQ